MEKYKIYCTEEQTKKALKLGAKVKFIKYSETEIYKHFYHHHIPIAFPTAEQMIGWLRSQGVKFLLSDEPDSEGCYWFVGNGEEGIAGGNEKENKELAAIDAALEYLENLKQ